MQVREKLRLDIESHGGTYCKDLHAYCTQLICAEPAGPKYEQAMEWHRQQAIDKRINISVVSMRWLEDSIKARKRQPESRYPVLS